MFPPYYSWLEQLTFEEYLPCIAKPGDTVNRLTEHCKNYYTIWIVRISKDTRISSSGIRFSWCRISSSKRT